MNFKEFYHLSEISRTTQILDFKKNMLTPKLMRQMLDLERDNFGHMGLANGEWMIRDHFNTDGFIGKCAIAENGDLVGYIYGYDLFVEYSDGDLPDVEDVSAIKWHDEEEHEQFLSGESTVDYFKHMMNSGKCLYVANFVIKDGYTLSVMHMLRDFVNECKKQGIKYIAANCLKDSFTLFVDPSGNPKVSRLQSVGMNVVCYMLGDREDAYVILKL